MTQHTNDAPKTQLSRCNWCLGDPIYMDYHDTQWGKPVYDDEQLFAMLCLEAMQSGLSWITILKRKDNYYRAFDGFDTKKISQYDDDKINALMQDAGIIRHRKKIEAIVANARAYLAIQQTGSFADYLWAMTTNNKQPVINKPKSLGMCQAKPKSLSAWQNSSKKTALNLLVQPRVMRLCRRWAWWMTI